MSSSASPTVLRSNDNEHRWWIGLTALLGAYYVLLGVDALPKAAGFVGIAGGVAIWGAMRIATRSHRLAVGLLAVGAMAFAIVTWWSVVTPLTAILVLTIGPVALRRRRSGRVDVGPGPSRVAGSLGRSGATS